MIPCCGCEFQIIAFDSRTLTIVVFSSGCRYPLVLSGSFAKRLVELDFRQLNCPSIDLVNQMSILRAVIAAFDTELGYMAVAAQPNGVLRRIWFDYDNEVDLRAAIKSTLDSMGHSEPTPDFNDAANANLVRRFKKFASGQVDTFADVKLDLTWATPFQQRVIARARAIPYGKTLSYGSLASRAGFAGAARAVGSVMAKNRFPLVVPCHRVVASGNHLGGFSSHHGTCTKERLLEMEGAINEKGALIS